MSWKDKSSLVLNALEGSVRSNTLKSCARVLAYPEDEPGTWWGLMVAVYGDVYNDVRLSICAHLRRSSRRDVGGIHELD